jgi:hypothetical protein
MFLRQVRILVRTLRAVLAGVVAVLAAVEVYPW